ncbi:MAG: glycosyltransferase [Chitinophagaceae bacterium]|nr:glycosyltransferase [Chitinophagaceae bacterium]
MELTKRKRILVFVDWYEPGFRAGGPIRSCVNFSDNMGGDYDVFVFTTDRDLGENQSYVNIECDEWIMRKGVAVLYASPSFLKWKNIRRFFKEIKPDYVYINSMYSHYFAVYPLLMKWLGLTDANVILAPRGMLKKTAIQFKSTRKKVYLLIFKLLGIHKKIVFHATDSTETGDVKEVFGSNTKCSQISNFPPLQQAIFKYIKKQKGVLRIIFVGRIHPIKNLTLLLEYLKDLRAEIVLTIVGAMEDEAYWNKCQQLIRSFPANIGVAFKKDIPNEDIGNLIADHHIFALPTEGENFGHAIFEALSVGRPVLISDQTPWRNLPQIKAGWDLPLNAPFAFVDALNKVAEMDEETFRVWSKGAWQLANDYITKSDLKSQYLKLFS